MRTTGKQFQVKNYLCNILLRYTQIGLVSSGDDCFNRNARNPDLPGIYTRITAVKRWIKETAPGVQFSDCDKNMYG